MKYIICLKTTLRFFVIKQFWYGLDKSLYYLREKNERLLQTRKDLQNSIDEWHLKNKGNNIKYDEYKEFLQQIGYLKEKGQDFKIDIEYLTSIGGF